MPKPDDGLRRKDAHGSFSRDLQRYHRRKSSGHFLRSLATLGSIGWPIVGCALGGVFLGRTLDDFFSTGVRFTLMLLIAGTGLGTFLAFRSLERGGE